MDFPRVTIDCGALRNNLSVVRRCAPRSRVLAAIKANAYGHGLIVSARALADADAFGLARISEALALRAAGITHRLVLLEGVTCSADLQQAAAHRLDLVVHSLQQLAMLEALNAANRVNVWLKLDTGMHRLGLTPAEFPEAFARVRNSACADEVRVMSHLACADASDDSLTLRQLDVFDAHTRALGVERSIANSAGLIAWPDARLDWVRPGIMLYGVSPFAHMSAGELGLRPAMSLTTQLIAIKHVSKGATVGYGGIWRAAHECRIGIAAIGYADGYPRHAPSGAPVLVNGREAPLAGRVSMDMIAIDLTHQPDAHIGDEVVLWGAGLPLERVAAAAGTIGYELACRVSERVHRTLINE